MCRPCRSICCLHDLVPAAQRLDLGLVLLRQIELGYEAQPLLGDGGLDGLAHEFEALEDVAEHLVEFVEVALVLHQRGTREVVEILDAAVGEVGLQRLHQRQVFLQGDRHLGGFQLVEERGEHFPLGGCGVRPLVSDIQAFIADQQGV
jgi:hypothetical protein